MGACPLILLPLLQRGQQLLPETQNYSGSIQKFFREVVLFCKAIQGPSFLLSCSIISLLLSMALSWQKQAPATLPTISAILHIPASDWGKKEEGTTSLLLKAVTQKFHMSLHLQGRLRNAVSLVAQCGFSKKLELCYTREKEKTQIVGDTQHLCLSYHLIQLMF